MISLSGLSLFNREDVQELFDVVVQNRKKDKKIKKKASKIQELKKLLEQHPVKVIVDQDGIRLDEPPGWAFQNWDVAKRISELVFLCEETTEWLESLARQEQEQMKMAA
jgi:nitroreductase